MKGSILNPVAHAYILKDMEQICATAGVQERFIHESMTLHCGEEETEWVRDFKKSHKCSCSGLILHAILRPDTRCQAMAAALIRHYIDARVIPLNTLIEHPKEGEDPSVLLVPNFFVINMSKDVQPWRLGSMYDLMLSRSVAGKPSVLYVEDVAKLAQVYGAPFHDFLSSNFKTIED